MESRITPLSETASSIEIEVPIDELRPKFEEAYRKYRSKIELKGFRKGKVPLDLVKRLYGEAIEQEALDEIANELFRKAMNEKSIKPVGTPILKDMHYHRGEMFHFKVEYETLPQVTLKEYKGLKVKKPVHTVKPEDIDREVLRLQRNNSTREKATKVDSSEFVVTCDVQELDEKNLPVIGKVDKDARFYLADESLLPAVKEALKNAEEGGVYRFAFQRKESETGPETTVHASLTVKSIEKVILPEPDDDFAAKATNGSSKTMTELRAKLEKELQNYWDDQSRRAVVNSLTDQIVKEHSFSVPQALVNTVLEGMLEEIRQNSPKRELPPEFDVQQFAERNRPYAEFQTRWHLLRDEIIKQEKLEVNDGDFEQLATKESALVGIDKEKLIAYYRSSDRVRDRILSDKLYDLLSANAKIKETKFEDESKAD